MSDCECNWCGDLDSSPCVAIGHLQREVEALRIVVARLLSGGAQ